MCVPPVVCSTLRALKAKGGRRRRRRRGRGNVGEPGEEVGGGGGRGGGRKGEGRKLHRLDSFFNVSRQFSVSPSLPALFTHLVRLARRWCRPYVFMVAFDYPWCRMARRGALCADCGRRLVQHKARHGARSVRRGCGSGCDYSGSASVMASGRAGGRQRRVWRSDHRSDQEIAKWNNRTT